MPPKPKMFEQIFNDVNIQIDNPQFDFIYHIPKQFKKSHYLIAERGYCQHDLMFYPKGIQGADEYAKQGQIYVIVDMKKPYKVDAEILANKKPETIKKAMIKILERKIVQPNIIWSDSGGEFRNNTIINFCENNDIDLRFTVPGRKSQNQIVEMMNKYLRQALMGYNNYSSFANHRRNVELFKPHFRNFINALNNYWANSQNEITIDDLRHQFSDIPLNEVNNILKVGQDVFIPKIKNKSKLKFKAGQIRYKTDDYEPEVYVITRVILNPAWNQIRYMVGYYDDDDDLVEYSNISFQRSELMAKV